eukprot:gene15126-16682_t
MELRKNRVAQWSGIHGMQYMYFTGNSSIFNVRKRKQVSDVLHVDLVGDIVQVGSIATQGRPAYDQGGGWFVQSYSLASSSDGENFTNLREYGISKIFEGNTDSEGVVKNALKSALKCRYLRIRPVTWHNHIALRVEVYKFTGSLGSSRKRSSQQRSGTKVTSDRTKSRPTNTRDGLTPGIEAEAIIKSTGHDKNENIGKVNDSVAVATDNDITSEVTIDKVASEPQIKDDNSDIADSFEIIEVPCKKETEATKEQLQESPMETVEMKAADDVVKMADRPVIEKRQSSGSQSDDFESRPGVDHAYSLKMKQASSVSTHNDGSKYIGKIKLIKKEQPPIQDEDELPKKEEKTIDCDIPEVVKHRRNEYTEAVLRKRDSAIDEDALRKRRSVILEDDLKYVNEMEVSMHERLKLFKETETKRKEEMELSKQEEEKRKLLKQEAEKRRSIAMQREQERLQAALLQKQKAEEEEMRRQEEISEKEAMEEFEEINKEEDEVATLPAIVSDRRRLFNEAEKREKEALRAEKEKGNSLKRQSLRRGAEKEKVKVDFDEGKENEAMDEKQIHTEVESSGEFVDIDVNEEVSIPTIVSDRLKMFKETEKQLQEKHQTEEQEAKRRELAKANAEKKRLEALEREKQRQAESRERIEREKPREDDIVVGEAQKSREIVEEFDNGEEIIAVEETMNVESEVSFDFMDSEFVDGEKIEKRHVKDSEAVIMDDERRRIREAKEKFMQIDKPRVEIHSSPIKKVGKLKINDFVKEKDDIQIQEENAVHDFPDEQTEESLDLQTRLQKIDTHHEGYDPDQERRMLEEAEAAFKSFKESSKFENRSKRSAKTENLIKSFSIASSNPTDYASKGDRIKMDSERKPPLEVTKSFDEEILIQPEVSQNVSSMPTEFDQEDQEENTVKLDEQVQPDKQVQPDSVVIDAGLVKQRANIFSSPALPAGDASKSPHANVKKWIASNHSASFNPQETATRQDSTHELQTQVEKMEQEIAIFGTRIEELKLEEREEEVLELEEKYHATKLELSKIKRQLLSTQKKGGSKWNGRVSSSSSVNEDACSDKASSSGSRTPRGGSLRMPSREIKRLSDKPQPPVDASAFNDEGEVVPEGNVVSQIQVYEKESARQRKERAEFRKSLSLSHCSLDYLDNPPPLGFGGPEFAKDKLKSSKECKLPRDTPVPTVESTAFNDEGDCVPEGNVVEQIKGLSKLNMNT